MFPINGYKERIIIDLKNNNIASDIIKMISSSIDNILSSFINVIISRVMHHRYTV